MTGDREHMQLQVEQLTCFVNAAYAGFVKNLRITWEYDVPDTGLGVDERDARASTRERLRSVAGGHTAITLDTPTYWGSMSGDIYEQAYQWREKLLCKLDGRAAADAALREEYGQ